MTSTASPRWRLPLSLLVAALVALVLACGGGDESPDEPAPATEATATEVATAAPTSSGDEAPATEAAENGAPSGQPRETQAAPAQRRPADAEDLRYVREVCLAGDVFDAAIEDVMEELGVDLETGEGVDDVSDEDMAEVLDALIPPMEELVATLQAIAPPPHAREFHEDAVAEWGAVTLSLASLLSLSIEDEVDPRAGLQRLVAILLEMQEALANTAIAPEALRSRLLSLEDDVPECASTDFLTTFLGPPPIEGQIDPVDEQYLRDVCAADDAFFTATIQWLGEFSEAEGEEDLVRLFPDLRDLLADLRDALRVASPPEDIAEFHEDYLDLLREGVEALDAVLEFVEREGVNADPGDLERRMGVLDRILGDPGDPVAPQAAVERLLDIAPSLRECDTVIIEDFLGVEDDY